MLAGRLALSTLFRLAMVLWTFLAKETIKIRATFRGAPPVRGAVRTAATGDRAVAGRGEAAGP